MNTWPKEELTKFAQNATINIEPFYEDQRTHGTPVTIWFVVVNQGIYIRAYSGNNSKWYQSATKQGAGKITAGEKAYDVNFFAIKNTPKNDQLISQAYHEKYEGQNPLDAMVAPKATKATILITPKKFA